MGAALLASSAALSCDGLIGLTDPTVADGGIADDDAFAGPEASDEDAPLTAEAGEPGEEAGHDATDAFVEGSFTDTPTDYGIDTFCQMNPNVGEPYCPVSDATEYPDAWTGYPDTGTPSGSDAALADGGGMPPQPPPTVFFVNAGPDLPSVRLCFAIGKGPPPAPSSVFAILPLPDRLASGQVQPGIERWAGAPIPSGLEDPSYVYLTAYLIPSAIIPETPDGGVPDCVALIGADATGGLISSLDYWALPATAPGTFHDGTNAIVLITGCLPAAADPAATVDRCGADYVTATGNLSAKIFSVATDGAFAPIGMFGAGVIQGSSVIDGTFGAFDVTSDAGQPPPPTPVESVWLDAVGIDGGPPFPPSPLGPVEFGTEVPPTMTAFFPGPNALDTLQLSIAVGDAGTVAAYSASFADIALATIDASTAPDGGPYFVGGEGYTFVVVGDPTAPLDSGLQPHFIAFPYHPVLPTYP
jgi:hypothetical protein